MIKKTTISVLSLLLFQVSASFGGDFSVRLIDDATNKPISNFLINVRVCCPETYEKNIETDSNGIFIMPLTYQGKRIDVQPSGSGFLTLKSRNTAIPILVSDAIDYRACWDVDSSDLKPALPENDTITVLVIDIDEIVPIADTEVWVYLSKDDDNNAKMRIVMTNDKGRFYLPASFKGWGCFLHFPTLNSVSSEEPEIIKLKTQFNVIPIRLP